MIQNKITNCTFLYISIVIIVFCDVAISQNALKNRIIGGEEIDISEAPWHALIIGVSIGGETIGNSLCGGTILSKKSVLTLHSCVEDLEDNNFKYHIFLGKNTPHEEDYIEVDWIYVGRESIALAILKYDLMLGPTLNVATVAFEFGFQRGIFLRVNGYPCDEVETECGLHLHKVDVPITSFEECMQEYDDLTPDYFCTGSSRAPDGTLKSTCVGDTGSGIMNFNTKTRSWELVGMVITPTCGHTPAKNLNIVSYYRWINRNLQ